MTSCLTSRHQPALVVPTTVHAPADIAHIMTFEHSITARFHEHVDPVARGSRYEDPLQAALAAADTGAVTGGGSQLNELGGIEFADVDIELADLESSVDLVVRVLEEAGAPRGSELLRNDGTVLREFGRQECVAVFLDGISLPDEVYATLDIDAVIADLDAVAGGGSYRGYWMGGEETALFLFGPDAEDLFARLEPALRALPVGQNARIVLRYGKESHAPRTVRLPRH